jgi:glycosyltransferase involved in cell wall biosynthesis
MQEYLVLRDEGYDVHLYSSHYDDSFVQHLIDRDSLVKLVRRQDTIVIYHHSIYWEEGALLLEGSTCKVYLRYHNITPDHFFTRYSEPFASLARQGKQQTINIVSSKRIHHYIADSEFNAKELKEYGVPPNAIDVLAPFSKIHEFESVRADPVLLESLLDGKIHVLSVGRIVPNKGLHHAISVIDRYLSYYGNDIRFNIIGGSDPHFQGYVHELHDLVHHYNMSSHVIFHGKVDFSTLHTHYVASHALLLLSEHEGFCLPILEAQYHKLPVIALDRGAVKKTLGEDQLVTGNIDLDFFAAAIHMVVCDNSTRSYLTRRGYENYSNYSSKLLSKRLSRILHETA